MITGDALRRTRPRLARRLHRRWEEAWNSHDPERLLALMTDDIVYEDSAWPTTMHGHADVRRFLDSVWTAMPDLRFEMVDGPFIRPGDAGRRVLLARHRPLHRAARPARLRADRASRSSSSAPTSTSTATVAWSGCGSCSTTWTWRASWGCCRRPGSRADRAGAAAQRVAMRVRSLRRP